MSGRQLGIGSISLDLDNQWSYMKTHGDAGWQEFPSYLDLVVPRTLDFFRRRNLTITYFVVGQDAALARNREALASIAAAGHEIGNHSFRHEPWLHLYSRTDLDAELAQTEDAIEGATGYRPIGFRGPGYSVSETVLQALAARGYRYDASTLPTFIGPLARAYYFATASLSGKERDQRQKLFGTLRDGLRPLKPYRWNLGTRSMLEIPVTTLPGLRIPIHFSYLLYLARFSEWGARQYFRRALGVCRLMNMEPSFLFHPLDFLGGDDIASLAFFPAMDLSGKKKVEFLDSMMDEFERSFRAMSMSEHARILDGRRLPVLAGRLAGPERPVGSDGHSLAGDAS